MKNEQTKISVKQVTEEIAVLMKDEIVATYTVKGDAVELQFLNGQKFRVVVEEIE